MKRRTAPALALLAALLAGGARAQDAPDGAFECLIEPLTVLSLGSQVEGVIEEVAVERGDLVTRGQVVAKLESGVEEATVAMARARAESDVGLHAGRARLAYQDRRLARSQALHEKRVIAFSTMDENQRDKELAELELREAEFNKRLARLELERAQQQLRQRTILSPIDGVVVDRFLSPGEYVYESAPLMKLARIDLLRVEAFLPITHYGTVRPGQVAEVRPQPPVGGRYRATITVVDRVLDAASGTFRVRLELPNPDLRLPAGIRCSMSFPAG